MDKFLTFLLAGLMLVVVMQEVFSAQPWYPLVDVSDHDLNLYSYSKQEPFPSSKACWDELPSLIERARTHWTVFYEQEPKSVTGVCLPEEKFARILQARRYPHHNQIL